MIFQKFRYYLASKILGREILCLENERTSWRKEQLKHGNKVTLEFKVVETGNKYKRVV